MKFIDRREEEQKDRIKSKIIKMIEGRVVEPLDQP